MKTLSTLFVLATSLSLAACGADEPAFAGIMSLLSFAVFGVMTSIRQYPATGFAGSIQGSDNVLDSGVNARSNVAKTVTIVITAVNSFLYYITANGVRIEYTADGSATVAEVRDGLAAAALASPFFSALGTLVASGSDLLFTEIAPADGEVTLAYSSNLAATVGTAHQNEEYLPAGIMAQYDSLYPTTDGPLAIKAANDSGGQALGIIVHEHQYVDPTRSDVAVIPPKRVATMIKRGPVLVRTETAVTPADVPSYRVTANGAYTTLGAIRTGTDSGNCVALTGLARFKHSASAGELVELAINLV